MTPPADRNISWLPDQQTNKCNRWRGLPLILAIWAFLACPATDCAAQTVYRISYASGAEIHTMARERVREVYERAGFAVEFVPMPQRRSIMSAAEGIVDGEAGRIAGMEERFPGLRRVNVKLVDLIGAAYVSQQSPITAYDKKLLDTYRVGVISGVQWSSRELSGRKADKVGEYRQLLGMLVEGRVDMVLGSVRSVEAVLNEKENRNRHVRRLEPLVFCAPLYHYVNERNAHIIPLLEKALRELWAEGRWDDSNPCPQTQ